MSKFHEALGMKKSFGPRTERRLQEHESLRDWARKGYRVVDTRPNESRSATEPRTRRGDEH